MTLSLETLAVLVLFLMPGYLAAQTFVRNYPYAQPSDFRLVLQIAVWSAMIHAVAAPATIPIAQILRQDPSLTYVRTDFWIVSIVVFVLGLIAFPLGLGLAVGGATRTRKAQELLTLIGMSVADQLPTAWDSSFRPGLPGSWVIVRLKDNAGVVAGEFGKDSVAGVTPHAHDVFLQSAWQVTPEGWRPIPLSKGVWVRVNESSPWSSMTACLRGRNRSPYHE